MGRRLIDADEARKAISKIFVLNEKLVGQALDMLRTYGRDEAKARLMTLDEVMAHYSLPPVFVDDLNAQEDYYEDIQPLYFDFPGSDEDSWIVHWRGHAQVAQYLNKWKDTYNKKWRCWTLKPTDKQKKAAKWDG